MIARPIRTTNDLLRYLQGHLPTRACKRAVKAGSFSILGGFKPPEGFLTIVIKARGEHGQTWNVGLILDHESRRYKPVWFPQFQWKDWAGDPQRKHPVYDGDDPADYHRRKYNEPTTEV